MTTTYSPSAAQAFNRFGFGGRPDDAVPADPIAWLTSQTVGPDTAPVSALPTLPQAMSLLSNWFTQAHDSATANAYASQAWTMMQTEQQAFLANAVTTKTPFRERLVWFWSNHYAVMAGQNGPMLVTSGCYVRDAIRANMTGTISQMLQTAVLHPAMVFSLNANLSFGPQSQDGIGWARGGVIVNINENLAREVLELYSVGIDAGYTQADVDALAYLLSGIDVNYQPGKPLGVFYNTAKQQPGNFTLMGTTFPGTLPGLMSALNMLGTHPATYSHLATKLVGHFTQDTPSPADVAVVVKALTASGGSLPAAHQAIIGLKNAWVPFQKFRTPADLMVATLRAANVTSATMPGALNPWVAAMGQSTWYPPFPNGYSDQAPAWTGPGPTVLRTSWASMVAQHFLPGATAATALAGSIGPLVSARTASCIKAGANAAEQLALLICSPEFQRR